MSLTNRLVFGQLVEFKILLHQHYFQLR